jgi:catalase
VQLAEQEDVITDPSTPWPANRPQIVLGTLSLTRFVDNSDPEIPTLFFSPMNLVPGIAASADPLLAARTRSYAISYGRRQSEE